jgi:hypothetical protein
MMFEIRAGRSWFIERVPFLPTAHYVLVFADPAKDTVVLYQVRGGTHGCDGSLARPRLGLHAVSLYELRCAVDAGSARDVALLKSHSPGSHSRLTDKVKRTTLLIEALLEPRTLMRLVDEERRPAAVQSLAEVHNYKPRQVLRVFERSLEAALNVRAAAEGGHHRSGKRPNVHYAVKQGRPRNSARDNPELAGRNVSPRDLSLLGVFFDARGPEVASAKAYRDFKSDFALKHVQSLETGYVTSVSRPEHEAISPHQFRYHLGKLLEQRALNAPVKQVSSGVIRRILRGHAREGIEFPGQRLLIDSTVADVYLVCSWDRTRIIGRPIVYIVTDAATSAIVGLHVTLHPPSARQAKIALFNALTPKTEFLAKLGLAAWEPLFPAACRPVEIYADRGELYSMAGRQLAEGLPTILKYAPPYTPEWKGVVERGFKFLNESIIHWLPGTTKGRLRARGEPDARLDAVLTTTEFTKLLCARVLQWNKVGKPELVLRPELIAESVDPGPADVYHWGLAHLHGSPRFLSLEETVRLLIEGERTGITSSGITLNHLRWSAEWMNDPILWQRRVIEGGFNFHQNPWAADQAWAISAVDGMLRNVGLTNERPVDSAWATEDLLESVACQVQYRDRNDLRNQHFMTAVDRTCGDVLVDAKAATRAANEARKQSKRARVSSISDNRRAELAQSAQTETLQVPDRASSDDFTTVAPGYTQWLKPL